VKATVCIFKCPYLRRLLVRGKANALAVSTGLVEVALSSVGKGPKQGRAETFLASLRCWQVSATPPSRQHGRLDVDVEDLATGVSSPKKGKKKHKTFQDVQIFEKNNDYRRMLTRRFCLLCNQSCLSHLPCKRNWVTWREPLAM